MSSEKVDQVDQMDPEKWPFYDPPSGWMHGFPRAYRPLPGETLEETLIRDGYPAADAAFAAKHCRFIGR